MPGCDVTYAMMCGNPQEVFDVAAVVWVLMFMDDMECIICTH